MIYGQGDAVVRALVTGSDGPADNATGLEGDLPQALGDAITDLLHIPRARGWIHVCSAAVAVLAGAVLVPVAWVATSPKAGLAMLIYALAIVAMFTISAVYHRVRWTSPAAEEWMKRLDHSAIFIFIAGSYTPFALLAMPAHTGVILLSIVWTGAVCGVALKMLWPSSPRSVGVPLYLLLGYTAVWFAEVLLDGAGPIVVALLVAGGVLYNVGAVCYAFCWPNPWPRTFGYHEFFHAFTAAAASCHYVAMWFLIF